MARHTLISTNGLLLLGLLAPACDFDINVGDTAGDETSTSDGGAMTSTGEGTTTVNDTGAGDEHANGEDTGWLSATATSTGADSGAGSGAESATSTSTTGYTTQTTVSTTSDDWGSSTSFADSGEDSATTASDTGGSVPCDDTTFTCGDGTCIPGEWECDIFVDCGDGSDEHDACV